ncbi:hypothetical protein GA-1p08 [Bacillus phage GA1]|uniref:Protein p56 n=1 Tax=Bacillus phage GA-1 TaxID=2679898 RepID=P56_BPGA1|nr:hypothetical protein GA-1p08 [Bacillus phage GA1]Q9FZX0.1 RecName: Full=Protein p56 [Bacillus phage GA1]CAC21523.1 hypothetical protein [Bacillus phage GA1]
MNKEKNSYRDAIKDVELTMMAIDSHFRTHKGFTDSYLLVMILENEVGETRLEVSEGLTFDEVGYIVGSVSDNILHMHTYNYCEKNREDIYKWLKASRIEKFKSDYAKMLMNMHFGKENNVGSNINLKEEF